MTKETLKNNPPDLVDLSYELLEVIPDEFVFRFYSSLDNEPIFLTLAHVSQSHPQLLNLSQAVFSEESHIALQAAGNQINPDLVSLLKTKLVSLPNLPKFPVSQHPLDRDELFLLDHDLATPLQMILNLEKLLPQSYFDFFASDLRFSMLRYRHADKKLSLPLDLAYSDLIRKYSALVLTPAADRAIHDPAPFPNYEMYMARSAFRELGQINPLRFAESFPVRTEIEHYIRDREFQDKNTFKPVKIALESSADPLVFLDKGDLYRMLWNLFRDAVTYGEGDVITPLVRIQEIEGPAELCIDSPGVLEERVLQIIGRAPYTTRDRGNLPHGYGKLGARKLLEELWKSVGKSSRAIQDMLSDHWSNDTVAKQPYVRWKAPLPLATGD